ncbi:MAG: hypothetical protein AB8B47_01825 [Roseobacter sp.]
MMDFLIVALVALNVMLMTAFCVVKLAQLDRQHARQAREEQKFKSHFRGDKWH